MCLNSLTLGHHIEHIFVPLTSNHNNCDDGNNNIHNNEAFVKLTLDLTS